MERISESTKYTRPPIIEAILDIQVQLPSDFNVELFAKCQEKVKQKYPNRKAAKEAKGHFSFGPTISTSASSESTGYFFVTSNCVGFCIHESISTPSGVLILKNSMPDFDLSAFETASLTLLPARNVCVGRETHSVVFGV